MHPFISSDQQLYSTLCRSVSSLVHKSFLTFWCPQFLPSEEINCVVGCMPVHGCSYWEFALQK